MAGRNDTRLLIIYVCRGCGLVLDYYARNTKVGNGGQGLQPSFTGPKEPVTVARRYDLVCPGCGRVLEPGEPNVRVARLPPQLAAELAGGGNGDA